MNTKLAGGIVIIIIAGLALAYASYEPRAPSPKLECVEDSDCITTGCSSQLCVLESEASDTFTTCEWKEEYDCLELTSCGCSDGRCQFQQNEEYTSCLEEI